MRWQLGRRSSNIEDRRGGGSGFPTGPGIRVGRAGGIGGLGAVALIILGLVFGFDPSFLLQGGNPIPQQAPQANRQTPAPGRGDLADFVSVVLADTEDTWAALFEQLGQRYQPPMLVLYDDAVESACGISGAATGPFYCPGDRKVYLDLAFFAELTQRFKAPGDFAQAYVVAHEVGHHVQNLLGIAAEVRRYQQGADRVAANDASVRLELQADCFAGIWAHHADRQRQVLEQGDIEEALGAATAIGDDRLQRRAQGYVNPDSFTHGTSAQRVRWFKIGLDRGTPAACNTFDAAEL